MSGISGADLLGAKFKQFTQLVETGIEAVIEDEIHKTQAEAVSLCPVHTGVSRDILAGADAITVTKSKETGGKQWTFRVPKAAYKLVWVEFGTKAYEGGAVRARYTDKKGRKQLRIVKRSRPAHRAFPFFRPAVANLIVRMKRARELATVVNAAKATAGFVEKVTGS